MEKASFCEIIVMVNNKKRCPIKDTMSIKISFMHYRNYITWTRVKWLLLSFHHRCQSLSIWVNFSKNPSPPPPGFYAPDKDSYFYSYKYLKNKNDSFVLFFCSFVLALIIIRRKTKDILFLIFLFIIRYSFTQESY